MQKSLHEIEYRICEIAMMEKYRNVYLYTCITIYIM